MLDRRTLMLTAGAAALARPAAAASSSASAALKALFDAFAEENLDLAPELATRLGLDTGPRTAARGRLNDRSAAGIARRDALAGDQLRRLEGIDRRALTGLDAINFDTVRYGLAFRAEAARRAPFGDGAGAPYLVTHWESAFQSIPLFLNNQHRIERAEDAEAYLERMRAYAVAVDQQGARVRADAAAGVVPPSFILDNTIAQLQTFAAEGPAEALIVTSLARRAAERGLGLRYAEAAARIHREDIVPALARQLALMRELRRTANDNAGVWKLKDGDAYYALSLKGATTRDLDAHELHAQGVAMAAEVSARMDEALKAQGMSQGSVGDRIRALYADRRFMAEDSDAGKARLVADLNVRLERLQAMAPRWFGTLPRTKVEARRVPREREAASGPGYYEAGSLDGARPGYFFLNLRSVEEMPSWMATTVTYHEAFPGHHMQLSVQQEAGALPLVRRATGYAVFSEGWALYAEKLADEMGAYADDPMGRIGFLQSALFRWGRIVVDTGLHAKRWTRRQAVDWLVQAGAGPAAGMESEVDRYCVIPGQACSYMVGRLTFDSLRDRARAALGPRFDIREFHDACLTSGSMPMGVLEAVVRDHVAGKGGLLA